MKDFINQSLIIGFSFLSISLWAKSDLAVYTIPLLGILTSFYVVTAMRARPDASTRGKQKSLLIVFLLNTASLLLIQATGGLNSLLFFLLYFLAFYISFMLKAETVFLFTGAALFFFLPEATKGDTLAHIAKLTSFLLLSPLAYFFGKEIVLREKEVYQTALLKADAKEISEEIMRDVSEIVKSEGKSLKEENVEKLREIVEDSRRLEEEARD